MNSRSSILAAISSPHAVITYLKNLNLLKSVCPCESCNKPMFWTQYSKGKDGYTWKCQNAHCRRYKYTTSIRIGSFFANSKITSDKWVHIIYCWSMRTGNKNTMQLTGLKKKAVIDAFASLREICQRHLLANPIQLGGPGVVVQIDESCFGHKVKGGRGRAPKNPLWVFGMVDTSFHPATGYMEIVTRRDAATLLPIIHNVARPGTIIHSDEWRAYMNVSGKCYHCFTLF